MPTKDYLWFRINNLLCFVNGTSFLMSFTGRAQTYLPNAKIKCLSQIFPTAKMISPATTKTIQPRISIGSGNTRTRTPRVPCTIEK